MSMLLNKVLHCSPGAALVLHLYGVDALIMDRPVERHNVRTCEVRLIDARFPDVRRNDYQTFDMSLQHRLSFCVLGCRVFIRGGQDDGISMLTSDRVDRMGAGGKERVVKIGDDQSDGARLEAAQRTGHLVWAISELLDGTI